MLTKKLVICFILALALTGCSTNSTSSASTSLVATTSSHIRPTESPLATATPVASTPIPVEPSPITTPSATEKPVTPVEISNVSGLSTKKLEWSWMYSPKENSSLLKKYEGYANGDTSSKIIYLTFDEGYENGYTASILDTLKANGVKAAFFVTAPFVTASFNGVKDSALLLRMSDEGHLICDHSVHHQSMPSFTKEETFDNEILGVETLVNNIPNIKMSKFFRPPMGDFSELSLYYTQKLGFRSIFFSLAHNDWDPDKQPDPETAKQNLLKNSKPGMICLLHALSKTNATILDSLIKEWKADGYIFKTLNDLP